MLIVFFVRLNLLGQDGGHQEEDAGHEGGEGQRLRQVRLQEIVDCPAGGGHKEMSSILADQ